jgi:hypothetical protein
MVADVGQFPVAARFVSLCLSLVALLALPLLLCQRRRIEHYLASKPPPKPWKHSWIVTSIGAVLMLMFPFGLNRYAVNIGIRFPVGLQVYIALVSITAALFMFFGVPLVERTLIRKQQIWQPTQRFRFGFTMIALSASLFSLAWIFLGSER